MLVRGRVDALRRGDGGGERADGERADGERADGERADGERTAVLDGLGGLRVEALPEVLPEALVVVVVAAAAAVVVTSSTSSALSIRLVGIAESAAEVLSVEGLNPWAY